MVCLGLPRHYSLAVQLGAPWIAHKPFIKQLLKCGFSREPDRILSPASLTYLGVSMATTTDEYLLGRYGPLMSIGDIASLLGRSADGVRVALYSDGEVSKRLKPAMIRVGRRVYFRTLQIKDALRLDTPTAPETARS